MNYPDLVAALVRGEPLAPKVMSGEATITGDISAFQRLVSWIDQPDPAFPIVSR